MIVVVDGLQDRLPHRHECEVLLHDVHVVALGVERRELDVLASLAVVAVVVVGADGVHPVLAEDVLDAPRERGLAGGRVPHHAEDDGTASPRRTDAPLVAQPKRAHGHTSLLS